MYTPNKNDVETIDGLMKAVYEIVSGKKGEPRQWERDRYIHHPKAVYSFPPRGGGKQLVYTLKEFHALTDDVTNKEDFFEYEIARKVTTFGNMATIWSSYETRESPNGPAVARGINSIQVYFDGDRWWITSFAFDRESTENPLPDEFNGS